MPGVMDAKIYNKKILRTFWPLKEGRGPPSQLTNLPSKKGRVPPSYNFNFTLKIGLFQSCFSFGKKYFMEISNFTTTTNK
jgi:hypothetical protein